MPRWHNHLGIGKACMKKTIIANTFKTAFGLLALSLVFFTHQAKAEIIGIQSSAVHQSILADTNWNIILNHTATTATSTLDKIQLVFDISTSSADMYVNVKSFTCADYESSPGSLPAGTLLGQITNTTSWQGHAGQQSFFYSTSTAITLPAGKCFYLTAHVPPSTHIWGSLVGHSLSYFQEIQDESYLINNSGPPWEKDQTQAILDAYYQLCNAGDCFNLAPGIENNIENPQLACENNDGLFSTATVKYIACIFLAPSQASLSFLNNSYEDLQTVPPFSLFFNITNTLEAEFSATSTISMHPVLTISIPGEPDWEIDAYTTSTLDSIVGTSTKEMIFNVLLMCQIIFFLLILWRKIKPKI